MSLAEIQEVPQGSLILLSGSPGAKVHLLPSGCAQQRGHGQTGHPGDHRVEAGIIGDEAIRRAVDFMEYCRVGRITLGETIRMRENCESFALETGEPSCFFTTSFLNGLFSAVKNQHVREVRCIAARDPYCEWEIT